MSDKTNYSVENNDSKIGNVNIADDVVASIAGIAAMEVSGVSKLTGNISKEVVAKLGKKSLAKGVKIDIDGNDVECFISVEIEYGNSIKAISEDIQTKVKASIENMTGLNVNKVNVVVSGIKLEK